MSSTSAAAGGQPPSPGPGDAPPQPTTGPAPENGIARGEPVDDPPPIVEPTGFTDLPSQPSAGPRPPRQSFLASAARGADLKQPALRPHAEPPRLAARLRPATASREPRWRRFKPLLARRLTESRAAFSAKGWRVWVAAAGVAIVLLAGFADLAGIGPFSSTHRYRETAPPSDPAERVAYYRTGAKAGDADAQLQLAILYAKGEGVEQDYATAATWFRAAAEQGSARAQYDLAIMYERGRGVTADFAEAAKWYRKAAEGNQPLAQYNLAVCYTKGQGVRQDLAEAALWYRRAAAQGVVQAMINLGMMYEKGEGVAGSPVDAYAWYRTAGRRASQPAAQHADDIYAALPQLDQLRAEALASDVAASIHDAALDRGEPR